MVIQTEGGVSREEALRYVEYLENKYRRKVEFISVKPDGEFVDLKFKLQQIPFERIRRITGYLVGDMSHWNDAKAAEEHDRVKHDWEVRLP